MRKLLSSLLILMALHVFGQVAPPQNQQWQGPVFIVPVQMGTDTLKNGEATVSLTEETLMEMKQAMAFPDYAVVLTPRGNCGQLNLLEKNAGNFIVKAQKGSAPSEGIFDYIVFVKQRRPMMPVRPHPPGQQPPATIPPPAPK